jgi:hypothetical protein
VDALVKPTDTAGATSESTSRSYALLFNNGDLTEETGTGIKMNDYNVASLHIPYGPGWDARRIDKLVYQTACADISPSYLPLGSMLFF